MKALPPYSVRIVQTVSVNSKDGKSSGPAKKTEKYGRLWHRAIVESDVSMLIF